MKNKIVEAYPSVSMLSGIYIKEKERMICIGGFSADGGFYLQSPYDLVKNETKNISGDATYYNFIKSSKKMCDQEKAIRKVEMDRIKYEKQREKELEDELNSLKKDKKLTHLKPKVKK